MSFVPGPYVLQQLETAYHGYEGWETFAIRSSPGNICLAVVGEVDRFHDTKYRDTARLMAAAPLLLSALQDCAAVLSGAEMTKSALVRSLEAARRALLAAGVDHDLS